MATRSGAGQRVMLLVTFSLEIYDSQGDIGFLGTDRHELKEEFSVVSNQECYHMLGETVRVEFT